MCGSRVEITDVMFKSISRIMAKMIWLPRENGFPSSRQSKNNRNLSSCSTIYAHLHFSWLDCQMHCAKNSVSFRSLNILSSTFCFDNFSQCSCNLLKVNPFPDRWAFDDMSSKSGSFYQSQPLHAPHPSSNGEWRTFILYTLRNQI